MTFKTINNLKKQIISEITPPAPISLQLVSSLSKKL